MSIDNRNEVSINKSIKIRPWGKGQMREFMEAHKQDQYWVPMDQHKWSSEPLGTLAASVCWVPVLVNSVAKEAGLGHFTYTLVPSNAMEERKLNSHFYRFYEEAKTRVSQSLGWEMYLLGGGPLDEYDEKELEQEEQTKERILSLFKELNIPSEAITIPQPLPDQGKNIIDVIIDPKAGEIGYSCEILQSNKAHVLTEKVL